jgi:filamentous hemagglutinin family protein
MNHAYRPVFNAALGAWVAVPETARAKRKGGRARLVSAAVLSALTFNAHALPAGGEVSAGAGTVSQSGSTMTVNQTSQNLAINWKSFNIDAPETVNFVQPNAAAIALNRVLGVDGTNILGKLNANGQVWILNPNGVLFGQGAQVNVGGLLASTLDISDADFMDGKRTFSGSGGTVTNRGQLAANYVALLGEQVKNEGVIVANLGTVALAAGNKVTLDFAGDKLLNVQIDEGALHALVENKALIQADGGRVVMTAKAKDALLDTAVNNSGVIQARTIENRAGRILLLGDMQSGSVQIDGTLDASATLPPLQGEGWGGDGANGGFIETSAAKVGVGETARVTTKAENGQTGTWLIDPNDFTIAASGGDISGATLSANLGGGNIEIQSSGGGTAGNGDIHVNDAVTWSANTLTLTAARDVNINAVMTANNTAALTLNPATANGADSAVAGGTVKVGLTDAGFTGRVDFFQADGVTPRSGTGFLTIGGNGYTVITDLGLAGSVTTTDLQGMSGGLAGRYALGANVNASATSGWNSGQGFLPVGNTIALFTGTFDGLGHTIDGLTINRTTGSVGLFGFVSTTGRLRNVGLTAVSIANTGSYTGGLAASFYGVVSNSYVTGTVNGGANVGGLVGSNSGSISGSHAIVTVSGTSYGNIGGLVGNNSSSGSISDSHASGAVSGTSTSNVGGLVGGNSGTVSNSHYNIDSVTLNGATGEVTPDGLYQDQYQDWLNSGKTLAVADYFTLDAGYYPVGSVQALKDLLGFADQASYQFRLTADLALPAGYMIPEFAAAEFDGGGHTLSGLQLTHLNNNYRGFIGRLAGGSVHDLSLTGVAVEGQQYLGGLAGRNDGGTLSNIGVSGSIDAVSLYAGGLVGFDNGGTITASHFSGDVAGSSRVGGLIGYSNTSIVSNSYATGSVSGTDYTGGLIGWSDTSTISNSYATGTVSGSGGSYFGGLVGYRAGGSVSSSFWDTQTSNQSTSPGGGTGKTTAEMQSLATFSAWGADIDNAGGTGAVWRIYDGYTTPLLRGFLTQLNVQPTYDGSGAALTNVGVAEVVGNSHDTSKVFTGSLYADTLTLGSTAADTYTATSTAKNIYSNQQGYDLVSVARSIATPGSALGDIALSAPISWTSGTLAINTAGTITQTAAINGTGTAIFDLQGGTWNQIAASLPGFAAYDFRISGGTFIRALSGDGAVGTPYQLADIYGVQGMGSSGMLGLNYALANNVAAAGTTNWNGGLGFTPVGNNIDKFTGKFDGLGHTISNLSMTRTGNDFGLFGTTNNAVLQNVGLLNVAISGGSNGATGALAGQINGTTTVRNCYVDGGSVSSTTQIVGGLVGHVSSGSISYSYADVSVSAGMTGGAGYAAAGGLVGANNGAISYSYATGSVSAPIGNGTSMWIGGLAGLQAGGGASISHSYATGLVTGNNTLGGLVGNKAGGTITSSYWDKTTTGQATSSGSANTSGLTTAEWLTLGPFSASPSDGAWSTADWGAGNPYPGIKALPYITIAASASQTYGSAATFGIASILDQSGANASGLVNTGGLTWLTDTTAASAAGTTGHVRGSGATATGYQMLYMASLTVDQAPLTVTAGSASKTYDGLAWSGNNGVAYSGFVNSETAAVLGGALAYGGASQGAVNAGSYAITPSGLTSSNYAITFVDGSMTVNKAHLTVTADNQLRLYNE